MRHRKTENTMSLLGGALLGAAAMYLLDPEAGRRRRENLAESTGDALGRAGEAIGPVWDSVSEHARDLSGRLAGGAADARDSSADYLSGWGDTISSFGRRVGKGAQGVGRSATSSAREARDTAWDSARHYASRAQGAMPWHQEEESHAVAYSAAGITAAALGAGAIYMFDRTKGRARRKLALDQATRIVNDCGRAFRHSGRYFNDVMNRSRGLAHEARSRMAGGPDDVSPETVMQRVRSQMGHAVSNAGAISVMVNNDGNVTLTGRVLGSELDALLKTVQGVSGVNEIINRLDVQDTAEAVAGGDAGMTAGQRL